MWFLDEEKEMTNKEVLEFAKEGGEDAVRHFPEHILNNKDNMLALIQGGYGYLALTYCSDKLKKDMDFLKEAAHNFHYLSQNEFFNKINPELKNNKELLEIFAAKADDPHVKEVSNIKNQLDKFLNQSTKNSTKKI